MNKIIRSIILAILILTTLSTNISATSDSHYYSFDFDDGYVEISISVNGISEIQAEHIAQALLGNTSDELDCYSLSCTLFGHKMTYGTSEKVTHYYYSSYPHCKSESFTVGVCKNCDYQTSELERTAPAYCH